MSTAALTLLVALAAAPAATRPTPASLRKAFENNAHTLVEVAGGRKKGTGVIVGAGGQVVTSVEHVALDTATVRVGNRELKARVVAANARLKFAVIEAALPPGESFNAPVVRTDGALPRGTWLVGLSHPKKKDGAVAPTAGQVLVAAGAKTPFLVTDLALKPGSPLFDTRGRLVAIVVSRIGRIGSRALPLSAVQAQIAQASAP